MLAGTKLRDYYCFELLIFAKNMLFLDTSGKKQSFVVAITRCFVHWDNFLLINLMKKSILTAMLLFSAYMLIAQQQLEDSLRQKAPGAKITYLLELALQEKGEKVREQLINKADDIASHEQNDSLQGRMKFSIAGYYYYIDDYENAKLYLKQVEQLTATKDKELYLRTLSSLGKVYNFLDQKDSSFWYKKKSLAKSIVLKDSVAMANAYHNLGNTYYYNAVGMDYTEARKYFEKALVLHEELGVEDPYLYRNYGAVAANRKTAEKYFWKAEKLLEKDPYKVAVLYLVIGNYYFDNRLFSESFNAFQKGNRKMIATKNDMDINASYIGMGGAKLRLRAYKEAITYLKIPLTNGKRLSTFNKLSLFDDLVKSYEGIGDYKKAFTYLELQKKLKDSITKLKNEETLLEFDTKFKSAEKDKQIVGQQLQIAEEKNIRNLWVLGSVLSLGILIVLFQAYNNKLKEKKLNSENELAKTKEIEQLRTELLGNISHEIRTPLTLVSGNIQMALEEGKENKKLHKLLENALRNSKKVIEDANQILELLKFEKAQQKIVLSSVQINNFCRRIFLSFDSLAIPKSIELEYQSAIIDDICIRTDADKLEKIINNLVSNAIKYSQSNSCIKLMLREEGGMLQLQIKDEGVGIPSAEKEKVFERFYQAENAKNIGGIGIGLALSKEFAKLLEGDLIVESELEKGSVFTLTIPYVEELPKNVEKTSIVQKELQQTQPKLLIVEDNVEMSNFLKDILHDNYDCTVAFDGEEALEKVQQQDFDLITSDIMMPKVNGFEFRTQLNKHKKHKDIPFVFISAKSLEEDKIKGFNLGIDDYIVKPFHMNELLARIKNLIANKKTRELWSIKNKELLGEDRMSFDTQLLEKVENIVSVHMSNEDFKVIDLAKEIGYSQRQFTRLLKEYTGMSPVQFILEIRLQKAYHLLQKKVYPTLNEVKYEIGMSSTSYFNKKFKERFGILPNEVT